MLIKTAIGQVVGGLGDKLKVFASSINRLHEDSLLGQAFVASNVDVAPSLTGTAAREVLMLLKNNEADMDLVIEEIHFGASASLSFILHRNPTYTVAGLGANTPGSPHSLNFGQNKSYDVDVQIWDETAGGITGVTVTEDMQAVFSGVAEHNEFFEGGLILPPGTALGIDKGATAAEVTVAITFSMQPSGLLSPVT